MSKIVDSSGGGVAKGVVGLQEGCMGEAAGRKRFEKLEFHRPDHFG